MIFVETKVKDAFIIEPKRIEDERGFFSRTFCQEEFKAHGLNPRMAQCNISYSRKRGTLRGMHYQAAPHTEGKLVRCTRGAIYDVAIDLRPESPTFKRWIAVELTEENRLMLYVPEGFAHGFQALEDSTALSYIVSELYHPESEHGVRWNDPAFGIEWPIPNPILSVKDQTWPDVII